MPLFQLVKLFPPALAFLGTEVIPAGVFLALVALPFVDREGGKSRAPALVVALGPLLAAIGLGGRAAMNDAGNEHLRASQKAAAQDAADARELFRKNGGVPPEGPLALFELDPVRVGKRVFRDHCAACHSLDARPDQKGPDLGHYLTPGWLTEVIRAPDSPRFWGIHDTMGRASATPTDLAALVDFVRSLESPTAAAGVGKARVEKGKPLFGEKDCTLCHEVEGTKSGDGPNLAGYGSDEWLEAYIKNPKAPRFLGKKSRMTAFEDKLAAAEIKGVIAYLRSPEVRDRE